MPEEITVRAEAADSLIAARLVDAMVTEMDQLYAQAPGRGVGSGDDGVAEIKRMYVAPAARRQGLGRRLLEELEEKARELGYVRIRLDTGNRQPHAQAMYERAGYHPIENYNGNSMASFWGEKILR